MAKYDLGLDPESTQFDDVGQTGKNCSTDEQEENQKNERDDDLSLDEFLPHNSSLKTKTSLYEDEDADVISEDDLRRSKYEVMEAQLRTTLIKQENVTAKLQEEIDSMKNEPTDIHMLAVYYLAKSTGKSWRQSKAAILSVLLSFLVVAVQLIISGYLIYNIITPTCSQDDDCPEGNFCAFDYNIYGGKTTQHAACSGECYHHNKFGILHFADPKWTNLLQEARCEDENDTFCVANISPQLLWSFCENLETPYNFIRDLCLRSIHCMNPNLKIESRYCDFVQANRDVLDFMGVFVLTIVGMLLVLNIHGDITSGRKQLDYLRRNVAPGLLKQICATVIIVSSTYLPFLAVQATVALMLGSPMLPKNIVLNALSIAFVLEIDNVIGKFALKAMKIEEESFRQKFEDNKKNDGADIVIEYFVIATCFVLFMYQILQVDKDTLKFGNWLVRVSLGRDQHDRSCVGIMYDLIGTFGVGLGIFFTLNVSVVLFEVYKAQQRRKVWPVCFWEIFTSLSAVLFCVSLTNFPFALEAILKATENYKIGTFHPTTMDARKKNAFYVTASSSVVTVLTILLWQMEKRLIGTNAILVAKDDARAQKSEDGFDENQYQVRKARKMNTMQKIYIATVVVSLFITAGLLGGLLPSKKSEFKKNYPECKVEKPILIGDGKCNGGEYNTVECNYDNGDCFDFNANYPNCTVEYPFLIGDGYCQGDEYNTEECKWDGGDCLEVNEKYPDCEISFESWPGDGWCNEESLNYSLQCGWDFGNCATPPDSFRA